MNTLLSTSKIWIVAACMGLPIAAHAQQKSDFDMLPPPPPYLAPKTATVAKTSSAASAPSPAASEPTPVSKPKRIVPVATDQPLGSEERPLAHLDQFMTPAPKTPAPVTPLQWNEQKQTPATNTFYTDDPTKPISGLPVFK